MGDTGSGAANRGPPYKYWAFISYSHADSDWSAWLHRALERYRVPRQLVGRETAAGKLSRRLSPIFRDRDELPGASELAKPVAESLAQSRFLIVVCSPHATASRYVNEEILIFKRLGRGDRVLCLIVDGEPGASRRPESGLPEAFPAAIWQELDSNGDFVAGRNEPLAADVRPGKDGKENAKLKLLAGIFKVGFDDLKQRERRRRRWRALQAAAAAIVVAGVTAGVWANRQRVVEEGRVATEAIALARESQNVTDKDVGRRLALALQSVKLTRTRYGYVLPDAEIALYGALAEGGLRSAYVDDDTSETFGGWTWPVAFSPGGDLMLAPSALGPTLLLGANSEKRASLTDPEVPYENDLAALASHDGTHWVTAGNDGIVRIWTIDGRLEQRFRAHEADIVALDQSIDGSRLLTVGCDAEPGYQSCATRSAKLWTLAGEPNATFTFRHEEANVISAAFSPTGESIVTAGETGTLRFWRTSGQPLFAVAGAHWVSPSDFGANGTRFVSGACSPYREAGMFSPLSPETACPEESEDNPTVALYDDRGTLRRRLPGWLAALSPDGDLIVTTTDDCDSQGRCPSRVHIRRWDGDEVASFGVSARIADVAFSPRSRLFALALQDGSVTIYDGDGRTIVALGAFIPGITSVRFSADGNRLVTVSCSNAAQGTCLERTIHTWDPNGPLVTSLPPSHPPPRPPPRAAFRSQSSIVRVSPSGAHVFAAASTQWPELWRVGTEERAELADPSPVLDSAFDSTETRMVTIDERGVAFRDVRGRLLKEEPHEWAELLTVPVAVSPSGVVAGSATIVRAWDWNGEAVAEKNNHAAVVTFVAASAAGDGFATIDAAGRAIVWDTRFDPTAEIDAAEEDDGGQRYDRGYKIRFTPDGARLVTLGPGHLALWTRDGRKLWDAPVDPVDYIAPEVSGNRVLVVVCDERGRGVTIGSQSSCYDSSAVLWDLGGNRVGRLDMGDADETLLREAAFNLRGNRIVTVTETGAARLWDGDGNAIVDLLLQTESARFDPQGQRLITVSGSGDVHVWQVWDDLDTMVVETERRLEHLQTIAARAERR